MFDKFAKYLRRGMGFPPRWIYLDLSGLPQKKNLISQSVALGYDIAHRWCFDSDNQIPMPNYIRFIVRTDHPSRTRCTGVVASLRILSEEGRLPDYQVDHANEIFDHLNAGLPCPPFEGSNWSADCISWFKDTEPAQEWISVFRDIIAIFEDADVEVGMLTTQKPGMIVYEDEYQIVAKSRKY